MAKTSSAKKANRVEARRRVFNLRTARTMKEAVKDFEKLVAGKKAKEAAAMLPQVQQVIDKAVKRGTIKKNTAGRMKSRLSARFKAIS